MNNTLKHLMREFLIQEADDVVVANREQVIGDFIERLRPHLADDSFVEDTRAVVENMAPNILASMYTERGINSLTSVPRIKEMCDFIAKSFANNLIRLAGSSGDAKIDFILKSSLTKAFKLMVNAAIEHLPEKFTSSFRYDTDTGPIEILDKSGSVIDYDTFLDEGVGAGYYFRFNPRGPEDLDLMKNIIVNQMLVDIGWWFSHSNAELTKIKEKRPLDSFYDYDIAKTSYEIGSRWPS